MRQNDERTDALLGKIRGIKELSISIHDGVREQNSLLDKMQTQFSDVGSSLMRVTRRIQRQILHSPVKKQGCYLIIVLVALFLLIYIFGNKKKTSTE